MLTISYNYGDQDFDPSNVFRVGTRFAELEKSLPNPLDVSKTENFAKFYNLFDDFDATLEKAKLDTSRALMASKLKEFSDDYEIHWEKIFKSPANRRAFSQLISEHFSRDELIDLCFQLDIDHENLKHNTPEVLAREIVGYCHRNRQRMKLISFCQESRNIDWLEGFPGHYCHLVSTWHTLKANLLDQIMDELRERIIIPLPLPPPSKETLDNIITVFKAPELFDALSSEVQLLFQLASNCFSCGLFSVACMLSWQATKITLGDYYHRMCLFETDKVRSRISRLTWRETVDALPVTGNKPHDDPDGLAKGRASRYTTKYHRMMKLETPMEKDEAWRNIIEAIQFSAELVEYWESANRKRIVSIYPSLNRDFLFALFFVERYCGGIGCFDILSKEEAENKYGIVNHSLTSIDGNLIHEQEPFRLTDRFLATINRFVKFSMHSDTNQKIQKIKNHLLSHRAPSPGQILDDMILITSLDKEDVDAVSKLKKIIEMRYISWNEKELVQIEASVIPEDEILYKLGST